MFHGSRCWHSLLRLGMLVPVMLVVPPAVGEAPAPVPLNATAAAVPAAPAAPPAPASGTDIYSAFVGKKFMQGPGGAKKIALTFDDGPHPKTTARLVEILKRENVKATFFMLGQMASDQPSLAKLVSDAGFEVGSHSFTHPDLKKKGLDEIRREIVGAQDAIQQVTGTRPRLFRPPYGNISEAVKKVAADDHLVLVNWSIDPRDWFPGTKADTIVQKVVGHAHPGAIVCMHDTKEQTVQAVPAMIAQLREKGYEFVTVSELIEEAAKAPAPSAGDEAGEGGEGFGAAGPPEQLVIPLNATARR